MKPVIAYVDDDLGNLQLYKDILSEHFTVETFSRALDLMKVLPDKNFDCFILDIYMPVVDGFQLFEKIRENPQSSKCPVFFVTSNPDDELKVSSFKKGATDFFDRLIRKDELIARLESRIKAHRETLTFIKLGTLSVDLHEIAAFIGKENLNLTILEFKILTKLLQSHPAFVPKVDLTNAIWGKEAINANNLNTHIYNLRMKITDWDHDVENHRVQGYYLKPKNLK